MINVNGKIITFIDGKPTGDDVVYKKGDKEDFKINEYSLQSLGDKILVWKNDGATWGCIIV